MRISIQDRPISSSKQTDFMTRNSWAELARGLALALAALLFLAGPASGAVKLPHIVIHSFQLKNGLRVYMVEDHQAPVASVNVWYHVGSKDERTGGTGFAHRSEEHTSELQSLRHL